MQFGYYLLHCVLLYLFHPCCVYLKGFEVVSNFGLISSDGCVQPETLFCRFTCQLSRQVQFWIHEPKQLISYCVFEEQGLFFFNHFFIKTRSLVLAAMKMLMQLGKQKKEKNNLTDNGNKRNKENAKRQYFSVIADV